MRKHSVRFSRQKILGSYVVDFYCAEAKLVIEIDGAQHFTDEGIAYDKERTKFLEAYDIEVIRISNKEVLENFSGVCSYIERVLLEKSQSAPRGAMP